jgi:hypothetical protein
MTANENQIVVYQPNETVRLDVHVGLLAKRGRDVKIVMTKRIGFREVA